MSERSENLTLPYIMPSQAQKHVTHNEAVRMLDALVHLTVEDDAHTEPPANPIAGARYIVGLGASGDWEHKDNQIAAWQDSAWSYFTPQHGWLAYVRSRNRLVAYDGSQWTSTSSVQESAAYVGINTDADTTNRLAAKTEAVLFSHDDVTPGTGNIQVKLNKESTVQTASLLFQNNWSARAEFGLTGNDDFSIKVSGDGSSWHEAMTIDADSGDILAYGGFVARGNVTVEHTTPKVALKPSNGEAGWSVAGAADGSFSIQRDGGGFGTGGKALIYDKDGRLGLWGLPSNSGKIALVDNINASAVDAEIHIQQIAASTDSAQALLRLENANTTEINMIECLVAGTGKVFGVQANGRSEFGGPVVFKSYAVSTAPSPTSTSPGAVIFVTDETDGPVMAFCDGANWRRFTDRAIIS